MCILCWNHSIGYKRHKILAPVNEKLSPNTGAIWSATSWWAVSVNDEEHLIELMIQYQAGRLEAFDEFYRLVKHKLYQYLIVKSLDRQLAEELLQETFLQIHRSRRTYLARRPVTPWIFSIAHHVYLTDRRARMRRSGREEAIENHHSDFPVPSNIEAAVEVGDIRNSLAKLPLEQRESLLLHHYWGFTYREIGATLGIRTGTAKLRAHRGLLKLREYLIPEAVTEPLVRTNRTVDGCDQ